ncbi:MAG: DUF5671 domain-containing protein [Candidatus Limnocylindrales bacterium]
MVTAKRLYLYGVMGVALVPLLWGTWSILRLLARALGATADDREAIGADVALDELSLAVALVMVALPVWLIHVVVVQRSLRSSPATAADELASPARATYFFLVLMITGAVALLSLYEVVQQLVGAAVAGTRTWGLSGALAATVVSALAWTGHVWWRRADLRAAPTRTAGDWLTRAYLYGGLFITAVLLAFWLGQVATVVISELAAARVYWDPWEEAIVSPLAGTVGCATGWAAQWLIAASLIRADPPLGPAHRASRTRTAYFVAVLLVSAAAALSFVSLGGRHVLAETLGVWRPSEGSKLASDIAGPLIMAVFFVVLGWWHRRRVLHEARAVGGPGRQLAVWRSALYVVGFAGLGALSIGMGWALFGLIEYLAATNDITQSAQLRAELTPGAATALAGLVVWAPTWRLAQQDHATAPAVSAASAPRRAYLLLVAALAVVFVMAALAYLTYQAIRMLLDAGPTDDPAWAVSTAAVAGVVLGYHLYLLRADGAALAAAGPLEPTTDVAHGGERVIHTVELHVAPDTDLEALDVGIRGLLPADAELRVVRDPEPAD